MACTLQGLEVQMTDLRRGVARCLQGQQLTTADLTLISQLGHLAMTRPQGQTVCHQVRAYPLAGFLHVS